MHSFHSLVQYLVLTRFLTGIQGFTCLFFPAPSAGTSSGVDPPTTSSFLSLPSLSALGGIPTLPPGSSSPAPLSSIPSLQALLASITGNASGSSPPKAVPLAYSPVLPPIPAKAVEKIRSGAYLDLKELLIDNVALVERIQGLGNAVVVHSPQSTVKLRSISDPLTWVFYFLSFMIASTECQATRDMAAYAQIVINQARKHPGSGWLAYDQLFRQQRAAGINLPWNDLAPSIMAATVLRAGESCALCHCPDHSTEQCALYTEGTPKVKPAIPPAAGGNKAQRFKPYPPSSQKQSDEICRRFNKGTCPLTAAACPYTHACSSCNSTTHALPRCPDKRDDKAKPPVLSSVTPKP